MSDAEVFDAWGGGPYSAEEWAVAVALGALTTLGAQMVLPEARVAVAALDRHRSEDSTP